VSRDAPPVAAADTLFSSPEIAPAPSREADRSRQDPEAARAARTGEARRAPPGARRSNDGEPQEGVVYFSAQDSLVVTFDGEGGDIGRLKGEANVRYNASEMDAHEIDLLFDKDEMQARADASGPRLRGIPTFQEEGRDDTFQGRELAYNFGTERGRVVRGLSQIEDGFVRAEVTRVEDERTIFIKDGAYTTADVPIDETPSYSLRASRMKIVDNEWIYTGPIQLYIFNIPTPLWLPFGFLPASDSRRSGPLPPDYGEDDRGFFLRNWGWYWAMNELMDFQVRGGIWTSGSWRLNPRFRYNRRDRYRGDLNLEIERSRRGERQDPDFAQNNQLRLRWSHSQDINPTSSFNANVDLTTAGFLQQSTQDFQDRVRQTASSSIRYQKNWRSVGRSITLSANQRQTFNTGAASIQLPQIDFRQRSVRPFQRSERLPGVSEAWYERLQVRYTGSLTNRYAFTPISDSELIARGDTTAAGEPIQPDVAWFDGLFSPSAFREGTGEDVPFDLRATHRVPVSASFSVSRLPLIGPINLNFTPNLNYEENWFISTERRQFNEETERVEREDIPGFFSLREFNTGLSMNTSFFGTFPVRVGPFDGVRHTARPSIGFTYRPDYFAEGWGYTRTFERPVEGEDEDRLNNIPYPPVEDEDEDAVENVRYPIVRGVPQGEQRSLNFSLNNTFETRRVSVVDTTGERRSDTVQFLSLNASANFNFAADEFKLSDISLRGRIPITQRVSITTSATLSPYKLNDDETGPIDEFIFNPLRLRKSIFDLRRLQFGRLTRISANTSFRVGGGGGGQSARPGSSGANARSRGRQQAPSQATRRGPTSAGPAPDPAFEASPDDTPGAFSIPWSANFRVSYSLRRSTPQNVSRTATVNTSFQLGLTPQWRVSGNTGYDFV
ncbi:MAG: hypothetical protein GVY15_01700, partial [Bacteroidetes bacterium]|nr:hypothetical protein [Bacteroidota bacterium]